MTDRPAALAVISAWAQAQGTDTIPPEVLEKARLLLIDWAACATYGSSLDWVRVAADHYCRADAGHRIARIIGRDERSDPTVAAFVNSVAAYSSWLMDGIPGTMNVGSSVIGAALAAAEESNASVGELLAAVVVGYEVAGRLASVANRWPANRLRIERGFSPISVCAPFGAAAAVACIRRLEEPMFEAAVSLAAMSAGGIAPYEDEIPSVGWLLSAGTAARAGLECCTLAVAGVRGNRNALDAVQGGFFHAFGTPTDLVTFLKEFGHDYLIRDIVHTTHGIPLEHHPYLDALHHLLMEGPELRPTDISQITCYMPPRSFRRQSHLPVRGQPSYLQARNSLKYAIALEVLCRDTLLPPDDCVALLGTPTAVDVLQKFRAVEDEQVVLWPPKPHVLLMEVQLQDGAVHRVTTPGTDEPTWWKGDREQVVYKCERLLRHHGAGTRAIQDWIRSVLDAPLTCTVRSVPLLPGNSAG